MLEEFKNRTPLEENSGTKNKSIQLAVEVLKETAEKFRSLKDESCSALKSKENGELYLQKLRERAQLLVDLPSRLSEILEGLNSENKQKIVMHTKYFATIAQEAIDYDENGFMLGVLLTIRGDKKSDKNSLEQLIYTLEEQISQSS